jgi:hypothetical protein
VSGVADIIYIRGSKSMKLIIFSVALLFSVSCYADSGKINRKVASIDMGEGLSSCRDLVAAFKVLGSCSNSGSLGGDAQCTAINARFNESILEYAFGYVTALRVAGVKSSDECDPPCGRKDVAPKMLISHGQEDINHAGTSV